MSKGKSTPNSLPVSNIAYIYDGSIEGLLSAVFLAYANHENPQDIIHEGPFSYALTKASFTSKQTRSMLSAFAKGSFANRIKKRGRSSLMRRSPTSPRPERLSIGSFALS